MRGNRMEEKYKKLPKCPKNSKEIYLKMVETRNIDTRNTQIHDCSHTRNT